MSIVLTANVDYPLSKIIPGRLLNPNASSAAFLNLSLAWLKHCKQNHKICSALSKASTYFPRRVIDVGLAEDGITLINLHIVGKGQTGEWIASSHCWGKSQPITITKATIEARKLSLPLESLPPLFRDVLITRALGYQYLWIDSLCIIQDSHIDGTVKSSKLGDIYKNAVLCIAAEASSGCETGIFHGANRVRHGISYPVRLSCSSPSQGLAGYISHRLEFPKEPLDNSTRGPLSRQAWTLQEDILSSRVLKWTPRNLQ